MTLAVGTNSFSSSTFLAQSSEENTLMPVTLPPGRLRLATRPNPTGSLTAEIRLEWWTSQSWPRAQRAVRQLKRAQPHSGQRALPPERAIARLNRIIDRTIVLNGISDADTDKHRLRADLPRLMRRTAMLNRAIFWAVVSSITLTVLVFVALVSAFFAIEHERGSPSFSWLLSAPSRRRWSILPARCESH